MTNAALIVVLGALKLLTLQNHTYTQDDNYYDFPRFWTSTGFCPYGNIGSKDMRLALLSDSVQLNLRYIAALPHGTITHVRIHWLLELIDFVGYRQSGAPIYDFTQLDNFLLNLDDLGLYPVIEFMANPGDVFVKNPNRNDFYWEDFSYQLVKHYLNSLGAAKLLRWRFESWNEPDVRNYNRLNFTVEDYVIYLESLHKGLVAAGYRPTSSLHFPLRGPAGLLKAPAHHPLCWGILQYCNKNFMKCPLEVLTYHRKGNGTSNELLAASFSLLSEIFEQYPKLQQLPLANDEADPISGWSVARPMQADVRYAHILVTIVLQHWSAMKQPEHVFANFESLSHDNAFLSYHPHEFSQRTLLAHFRMNLTQPIHSQFIQKPVYAALGLLAKLAPLAADLEQLCAPYGEQVVLLKTTVKDNAPLFLSWLLLPAENSTNSFHSYDLEKLLPFELCSEETYSYVVEILEQQRTDPAWVWKGFGQPPYPNASVREAMRRSQTPLLHSTGLLKTQTLHLRIDFKFPWIMLLRICSNLMPLPRTPQHLMVTEVTRGETLLTWREVPQTTNCLKTYEVWFKELKFGYNWTLITNDNWHVPFPSFHYAPKDLLVNGFYKVRALDIFERHSKYSEIFEYIEL